MANIHENSMMRPVKPGLSDAFINKKKSVTTGPEIFRKFFDIGNKGKIDIDSFAKNGTYKPEIVDFDKKRVEEFMQSDRYERATPASIVLENVISVLGNEHKWFVDDDQNMECFVIQLSMYDDKMKDAARADIALETKTPDGEIVRLLIDATTEQDSYKLLDKGEKCVEKIKNGTLHSVKYFQSGFTGEMGKQDGFPMVIAGMDKERLQAFCARAAENGDLENDYAMFMVLDEIVGQLTKQVTISNEINGKDHAVTKTLMKTLETFSNILGTKNNLRPSDFGEKVAGDPVYEFYA